MEDGFSAVDEHFAEQRAYIEFAFTRVDDRVTGLEQRMDRRFDRLDGRFDRLEGRFDRFETKLDRALQPGRRRKRP